MMGQRILVTGGAGFIGSHTVALLLEQDNQVVVLDNLSSGKQTNLNLQHPNLEFIESDVLEYPFVEELVSGCDAVLHLAAIASVPLSIENPIYTFQVNTQGFLHVLKAVQHAGRPIRLVYASSAAVYGDVAELPCRDDTALTSPPLSPYALQKIHAEDYAGLYERLHGVRSLALRYFNVYGQGQDPASPYSGVISRFLDAYKAGTELTIFGDGQQSRDFIHVADIAKANALALRGSYSGALNIATGEPQTLLHLVDYIQSAGEQPARVKFAPGRSGDIKSSYGSTKMAEQYLDFKASIALKEGMRRMLNNE
jgi:UDP-glucose 4-epimerase